MRIPRLGLHDATRHPPARLGRRGATLLNFAIIWCGFGIGALDDPAQANPALLYEQIPGEIRFGMWVATALFAAAWAFSSRRDWPGFVALILMPAERAVSHAWAWVVHLLPGGGPGQANGWLYFLIWLAIVNQIVICAGWREAPSVARRRVLG